ncbi:MAG: peptide ABC transporter substrate-binding protein [Candidatus Nomurabacteria bacterium]
MDTASIKSIIKLNRDKFLNVYKTLTPEKVIIVWLLIILAGVFLFAGLLQINNHYLISIPARGGYIHEGILGTPRFINPVLATSDADKDMVELIYAGLTKRDHVGNIIFDVASSVEESSDNLHYDIKIKPEARFSDNTHVTTDDFIYTISLIQNPLIKSPHRVEWEGVTIEKKNDLEFSISLKKAYPLFMNVLTIGILPKHVWKNLTEEQISLSDLNIHATGSGPFYIKNITSVSGIPESFTLSENKYYTLGRPNIQEIVIASYQNEKYLIQAFQNGEIDRIHGISPEHVTDLKVATSSIRTSLLPRTFSIFFNPNKTDFLSDKKIRSALNMAINKQAIINDVLKGYGKVIETPFPFDEDQPGSTYDKEQSKKILSQSKYLKKASSTIEITLSTTNNDEMRKIAEMIQKDWEDVGVHTNLAVYEVADLNQSVIKERDFQALLYGSITNSPADLYAFWHSSQRSYPGLNISNYVSKKLDANLETIRSNEDELARINAYDAVKAEFSDEVPGIFLFAPSLIYVTRDEINSPLPIYSLDNSSRFNLVYSWYKYTEKVWPKTYYKKLLTTLENIIH